MTDYYSRRPPQSLSVFQLRIEKVWWQKNLGKTLHPRENESIIIAVIS